jgi:hypothetical protein
MARARLKRHVGSKPPCGSLPGAPVARRTRGSIERIVPIWGVTEDRVAGWRQGGATGRRRFAAGRMEIAPPFLMN